MFWIRFCFLPVIDASAIRPEIPPPSCLQCICQVSDLSRLWCPSCRGRSAVCNPCRLELVAETRWVRPEFDCGAREGVWSVQPTRIDSARESLENFVAFLETKNLRRKKCLGSITCASGPPSELVTESLAIKKPVAQSIQDYLFRKATKSLIHELSGWQTWF